MPFSAARMAQESLSGPSAYAAEVRIFRRRRKRFRASGSCYFPRAPLSRNAEYDNAAVAVLRSGRGTRSWYARRHFPSMSAVYQLPAAHACAGTGVM